MNAQHQAMLEAAGDEFATAIRQALAKAAAAYELRTGTVITRVEAYRKGPDWVIDARAVDNVPASLRDDLFK